MTAGAPAVALLYDDDAFQERSGPIARTSTGPSGLMGRQVAGRAFLDAYLRHGTWSEMHALIRDHASAESITRTWRAQPRTSPNPRRLHIHSINDFHETFFRSPRATLIHAPQPPDPAFAWARQQAGPGAFALSGVTHTLCSLEAVALLRSLVDAPFEPCDALVCTSRAVEAMVRAVTGTYAAFLSERFGVKESSRQATPVRLEIIPLGVDTERFRPATVEERGEARALFGLAEDEVAVLFVGRLSHHAKAHPYPLYHAAEQASVTVGRPLRLLLAGWTANEAVRAAFVEGARTFAPNVRTDFLDGTEPVTRRSVWHAADLFVSLSDNVQETFGLSVVEAMASGLPVIASDWDGYRDLVVDGETGFLVPTAIVAGATADATARLLLGSLNYDHFLAECSQSTAVDPNAAASALSRLVADESLRRRMGDAGRRRALEQFAWPRIIRLYESLWNEQETERRARSVRGNSVAIGRDGPAAYPSPERSFAGYPSRVVDATDVVEPAGDLVALERLLATPLTHHAAGRRVSDPQLILAAIERAPCTVAELDQEWAAAGIPFDIGRSTLAWMLKYGLLHLRPVP